MNKKLKDKFDSRDLKSLLGTIIFVSLLLFLIYYLSDVRERVRQSDREKYKGQTFQKIDIIQLTRKNEKLIKDILQRSEKDTFQVSFDEKNPNRSILTDNN